MVTMLSMAVSFLLKSDKPPIAIKKKSKKNKKSTLKLKKEKTSS